MPGRRGLSYKARRRWSLAILLIGLPAYVVVAVSVVNWLEASKPGWEVVKAFDGTPMAIPREQLPRLEPQPTFDARQLATVIAQATQQSRRRDDVLYVTMSGLVGGVTGLVFAALAVLFVELSRV